MNQFITSKKPQKIEDSNILYSQLFKNRDNMQNLEYLNDRHKHSKNFDESNKNSFKPILDKHSIKIDEKIYNDRIKLAVSKSKLNQ